MSIKRLFSMALAACLIIGLFSCFASCGEKEKYYDPIPSSAEENRVIATIGDSNVKYELFRFFFMARLNQFDGGDRTLWEGESANTLWTKAKEIVIEDITEIYGVFAVAKECGIDSNSDAIERKINESIKLDIDGGVLADGTSVNGYGSVSAYKKALKDSHCTDAVRRLLYRYMACLEAVDAYYVEQYNDKKIVLTDSDLTNFAASGNCAHVNRVFVAFSDWDNDREEALNYATILHDRLIAANGNYTEMVNRVFAFSLTSVGDDPAAGVWFGKNSTFERDYPDYYHAIFNTPDGNFTDIIEEKDGFYIVYGMSEYVDLTNEREKSILTSLYLQELYWGEIKETAISYTSRLAFTPDFDAVTPGTMIGS